MLRFHVQNDYFQILRVAQDDVLSSPLIRHYVTPSPLGEGFKIFKSRRALKTRGGNLFKLY